MEIPIMRQWWISHSLVMLCDTERLNFTPSDISLILKTLKSCKKRCHSISKYMVHNRYSKLVFFPMNHKDSWKFWRVCQVSTTLQSWERALSGFNTMKEERSNGSLLTLAVASLTFCPSPKGVCKILFGLRSWIVIANSSGLETKCMVHLPWVSC